MKDNNNLITGIYIRVSTEEQAKEGFSINAQKEKLISYANINNWKIYDFYIDDGISGKNITDRPSVTRLIEDVKNGKVNNILIYKLDRLTRSVKDLISLIEMFEDYNCSFNSVTEKLDTSNAVGRMFIKIIGIFAEFERENLAERVSFGYEQKTREGNYTNTNGVNGYDYIVGSGQLVVNEIEKDIVNKIFDLYLEGNSMIKIAERLNKEKVPTKRGGNWSQSTINSILTNPLYIGKIRYGVNKRIQNKSFNVNGKQKPIVKKDKFYKVQEIIKNRKCFYSKKYPGEKAYFVTVLRCSKCGEGFHAKMSKQANKDKTYITYYCNNTQKAKCNCTGISHMKISKEFDNYIKNIKLDEKTKYLKTIKHSIHKKTYLNDITNFIKNWGYLNTSERNNFIVQFVKEIKVAILNKKVTILDIQFI